MSSPEQIVSSIHDKMDEILIKFDISFMMLFGSVVDKKRNTHFASDLDIVVSLPEYEPSGYSSNPLVALSLFIDHTLQVDNTNVIRWEDLPIHLKFEIYKTGKEIFVKNRADFRAEMEMTMKLFWDHDIWHKQFLELALKNSR